MADRIKMTREGWERIGRSAGWMKGAGVEDIEATASRLEFLPTRKKPLVYRHWDGHADEMPPMSYKVLRDSGVSETFVGGEKETQRSHTADDIMVCGPEGECYTMNPKKFAKNYDGEVGGDVVVEQSPRMVARYDGVDAVRFTAPWGEEMLLNPGDYLVKEGEGQYYRIEGGVFRKTYGEPGS